MTYRHHDGGSQCRSERVLGNNTATAGGSGDNTEVNGASIAREVDGLGIAQSAKLIINYTTTLGAGQTLDFAVQMQDDDGSGTDYEDRGDPMSVTADTGGSGGSTETGTVEFDIDLAAYRSHVRPQITPNLSRANTDTAAWSAVMVFFGFREGPATKAGSAQHQRGYEALD